ncbi:LysM peptidoglycan-binding domain-containing protein [uncultured Algibacter sp.]|uniref:LysM peptidoglycan-binding domain-containing protein n=1 Tax=uncultured Algibacter sp. TaxID=298659 RepID=UPI00260163B0|nr:LysM peptidoglycan-binding domain-containing protein [uncultured Algibacter sp.]
MQKNYKILVLIMVVLTCKYNLQAQTKIIYKDVLLNGKPAKLNVATGEFTLIDSSGNDSIVNARKSNEDNSIKRLNYHTVKPGDNLAIISQQYGLTINKIKEVNNLKTTLVSVGQKLRVRNFDEEEQSNLDDIWVVSKGNTLYSISRKTGVSIETIKLLNGLKSNHLSIGQKLYLK